MAMRTLMTGPVWLSYGQISVASAEREPELPESFGGQQNGLCGAAVPGGLLLRTGLHTGEVDFVVQSFDEAPAIDDSWEEIVEASYRPVGDVALTGLMGNGRWLLALDAVDYRVRYCGWGMDAGHQAAPPMDGEPLVDRYLLQFWPAPPLPDQVIKQTSAQAAYWHGVARKRPPPPTPEQRAELQRERERRQVEARAAEKLRGWGGTPPSDRLGEIWKAYHLAGDHRPLLDAVEGAAPETQWAVARWIVRRNCVEAGLDQIVWIAAALDGLDRREDLWQVLQIPAEEFGPAAADGQVMITVTSGWSDSLDLMSKAMTLFSAFNFEEDPLEAVVEALWVAREISGRDRTAELEAELRQAFPALG